MKTTELKKLIKEAVREAIQEEIKDILLEAVRSPKPSITEGAQVASPVVQQQPNPQAQKALRQQMMSSMMGNGGNLNMSSNDANTLQLRPGMDTAGEGSSLPAGNVGLDAIMGLMNSK